MYAYVTLDNKVHVCREIDSAYLDPYKDEELQVHAIMKEVINSKISEKDICIVSYDTIHGELTGIHFDISNKLEKLILNKFGLNWITR